MRPRIAAQLKRKGETEKQTTDHAATVAILRAKVSEEQAQLQQTARAMRERGASTFRGWVDSLLATEFGEEPRNDVHPELKFLRVLYGVYVRAHEQHGLCLGERIAENYKAALTYNVATFPLALRNTVLPLVRAFDVQRTGVAENMAKKMTHKKSNREYGGLARPAKGVQSIREYMCTVFRRKTVPTDAAIIKEVSKRFPASNMAKDPAAARNNLRMYKYLFLNGKMPGQTKPEKFNQPSRGDVPTRASASKKATRKKAPAKKATSKKATRKKAPAKKATSKKATRKKAPAKKATSKKAPAKKATK
jgi:hypothetical protein